MSPVEFASAAHSGGTNVIFIVFAVLMGGLSLLHVIKPETAWKMRRWQFRNQAANEPSPAGYTAIRIGGIAGIAIAVVFVLIAVHAL